MKTIKKSMKDMNLDELTAEGLKIAERMDKRFNRKLNKMTVKERKEFDKTEGGKIFNLFNE